jgi:hypothetical protein
VGQIKLTKRIGSKSRETSAKSILAESIKGVGTNTQSFRCAKHRFGFSEHTDARTLRLRNGFSEPPITSRGRTASLSVPSGNTVTASILKTGVVTCYRVTAGCVRNHGSGGRSSRISSFDERSDGSKVSGSHHSMRSCVRMFPPTMILQLSPERFSNGLNTFFASRFSR